MDLECRCIQQALWSGLIQNYSVMRNEQKILGLDESKMFTLAKAAFDINILDQAIQRRAAYERVDPEAIGLYGILKRGT